jgi:hypothetical protein
MCTEHSVVMSQDLCSLVVLYFTFGRIVIFMNQGHTETAICIPHKS